MKYIKKYENSENKNVDEYGFDLNKIDLHRLLKKYFIFYNFQNLLILSQITSNNPFSQKNYWKHIGYFNAKTGESLTDSDKYKLKNQTFRDKKDRPFHIVYESDELQDCLDYLDAIQNQYKYNL